MKSHKLIIVLLFSLNFYAQETNLWMFQIHEMEVISGNVNEFVKDQKEFFKKLAVHGVNNGEWAGWSCFRSITSSNKFVFVHHFNKVEQRVNPQIWTQKNVDELGLSWPKAGKYSTKTTKPTYIYQSVGAVFDEGEPSKFWKFNYHKFNNLQEYIKLQQSWGEMVVKKSQKNIKSMNWGAAILISNGERDDSGSQIYNGLSFDGFDSLENMLESQLYKPGNTGDPNVAKWAQKIQNESFSSSVKGGKSELFVLVDDSFN